jgi:hypothetical protein
MLNGAALSRIALNASAGAVLVLASATFSADATVTAAPDQTHAARATFLADLQGVFGPLRTVYAHTDWSASAVSSCECTQDHAGKGNWDASLSFQAVVLSTTYGQIDWEAGAGIEALADAKLGFAGWNGEATFDLIPTLTGKLSGSWTGGSTSELTLTEADRKRQVNGYWTGVAALWSEATITAGGTVYQEGYWFPSGGCDWAVDNTLNPLFVTAGFLAAGADWEGSARAQFNARGNFEGTATLYQNATRIAQASAALSHSATLAAVPTRTTEADPVGWPAGLTLAVKTSVRQQGKVNLVGNAAFTGAPWQVMKLQGAWSCKLQWLAYGTRNPQGGAGLTASALLGGPARVDAFAAGAWQGVASTLALGEALTKVPAPVSRQFRLSRTARLFTLSGGSRTFEVSA